MEATTKNAIVATAHCLTGCAIGEVLGMVLGTAFKLSNVLTTLLAIVLAFIFGYGLTMRSVLTQGVRFGTAVKVALAADTASIATMELIDNAFIWLVPGAVHAMLGDVLFWWSLLASLAVAFVVTVPVNRYLMARGKGHAVVHQYHDHVDHAGPHHHAG